MSGTGTTDTVAVTVHGIAGAVDLAVPLGAGIADVAREYAAQCGLRQPPPLRTSTGAELPAHLTLAAARIESGNVLVAVLGAPGPAVAAGPVAAAARSGPGAGWLWFVVASLVALLSAAFAAGADEAQRSAVAVVLGAGAMLGVLPLGAYAAERAAAAPAFAAAAGFAVAWEPGEMRLPLVVGIAALTAAVAAAVGRVLADVRSEVQTVWIATGITVFLVCGGGVLLDVRAEVVWSVLLVLALLASRFVPAFAIDVPDQLLIDLERLAVNAWSARDRTTGKRGRVVVPQAGIDELLTRAAYVVNAASVAALAVTVVAAPALLASADLDVDREGALALLFFAGAGFLLAARSYRHAPARILFRVAGLYVWACLAGTVLPDLAATSLVWVTVGAVALAAGVLVAAVATGRGWRSVWWARKAEVAEILCGAFAVGALVVSTGLFRLLWE